MAFSSIQYVIPLFYADPTKKQQNIQNAKTRKHISTTTEDLYKNRSNGDKVFIDIPGAKGIEVFIITGPELLDVVKKYNLLSGGGCLPCTRIRNHGKFTSRKESGTTSTPMKSTKVTVNMR